MATPMQSSFLSRQRRRKALQTSGGMSIGVADHVFHGTNILHTPSPPLTTAQVQAPATIIGRVLVQLNQAVTVWQDSTAVCLLGINAGGLIFSASGFGFIANIPLTQPFDSGEHVFMLGADPTTGRATIHVNGVKAFDDVNAGFTNWSAAGSTFSFGPGANTGADYRTLEIYLGRLPAGV